MDLLSYDDAFADAASRHNRGCVTALLGNGFSQAWRSDVFSYGALFDEADLSDRVRAVFDELRTRDFEVVMEALNRARTIVPCYDAPGQLVDELALDTQGVRDALADVLAANHPERPYDVTDDEFTHCRRFLSAFERIYTVNYDLLLYWTAMHQDVGPPLVHHDGFADDPDDPDAPYVVWHPEHRIGQNVFYLHGALHLLDAGAHLRKYTWCRTGEALVDQIREALDDEVYPLVVTEGRSNQKMARINHSPYLMRGLTSLREIGQPVIIYGHSLADNDRHVLEQLVHGRVPAVFVSVYGDPSTEANQKVIERAMQMREQRSLAGGSPLHVDFFAATTAPVWR